MASPKNQGGFKSSSRSRSGLGRGLGALIGVPKAESGVPSPSRPATPVALPSDGAVSGEALAAGTERDAGVRRVPVAMVHPNPWQPRRTFDPETLAELTESVRTHGVLQPLLCRRGENGAFELIAGERRLRAAMDAGLKTVPVLPLDVADREVAEMALVENLQREDLNIVEEAQGYRTLAERFQLTQQEVAERVGKGRATVTNALRLLDLPSEILQMLVEARLSAGHAKVLLGLESEPERIRLARRCVRDGLSVRALEQVVLRATQTPRVRRNAQPDIPASHLSLLTDRLQSHFGTTVRLSPSTTHADGKHSQGAIEIVYYSNDDLDRILSVLGIVIDDPA